MGNSSEQLRITYERCRSGDGVPIYTTYGGWEMWEDELFRPVLIQSVLEVFAPMAKKAHPDASSMWMPSERADDYELEFVEFKEISDLMSRWEMLKVYYFHLLDKP